MPSNISKKQNKIEQISSRFASDLRSLHISRLNFNRDVQALLLKKRRSYCYLATKRKKEIRKREIEACYFGYSFEQPELPKTIIERAAVIEMVRLGYRYKARQTFVYEIWSILQNQRHKDLMRMLNWISYVQIIELTWRCAWFYLGISFKVLKKRGLRNSQTLTLI